MTMRDATAGDTGSIDPDRPLPGIPDLSGPLPPYTWPLSVEELEQVQAAMFDDPRERFAANAVGVGTARRSLGKYIVFLFMVALFWGVGVPHMFLEVLEKGVYTSATFGLAMFILVPGIFLCAAVAHFTTRNWFVFAADRFYWLRRVAFFRTRRVIPYRDVRDVVLIREHRKNTVYSAKVALRGGETFEILKDEDAIVVTRWLAEVVAYASGVVLTGNIEGLPVASDAPVDPGGEPPAGGQSPERSFENLLMAAPEKYALRLPGTTPPMRGEEPDENEETDLLEGEWLFTVVQDLRDPGQTVVSLLVLAFAGVGSFFLWKGLLDGFHPIGLIITLGWTGVGLFFVKMLLDSLFGKRWLIFKSETLILRYRFVAFHFEYSISRDRVTAVKRARLQYGDEWRAYLSLFGKDREPLKGKTEAESRWLAALYSRWTGLPVVMSLEKD